MNYRAGLVAFAIPDAWVDRAGQCRPDPGDDPVLGLASRCAAPWGGSAQSSVIYGPPPWKPRVAAVRPTALRDAQGEGRTRSAEFVSRLLARSSRRFSRLRWLPKPSMRPNGCSATTHWISGVDRRATEVRQAEAADFPDRRASSIEPPRYASTEVMITVAVLPAAHRDSSRAV